MNDNAIRSTLDMVVRGVVGKKNVSGAVLYVSSEDNRIDVISAAGDFEEESQYYVASINKFFVSAIVLRLYAEKRLDLQDTLAQYLPEETVQGLHVYKGKEYSDSLTIEHLLSQTSGLPCYLTDVQVNGRKAISDLEAGIDQAWPIDRVIREVKMMKPHFPPGTKRKARYIDTNHQLVGLIIEKLSGQPVNIVLRNLFRELNLCNTYVCEDVDDRGFVPIRYKSEERHLPLFLTSTQNDIISTARDQMTFLKAFFSGFFFPKNLLSGLEKWNRIFFPFSYGIGIQKFHVPTFLSPFHRVPAMVGHGGSTGAVAFYVPAMSLYMTGTTNQQAAPSVAFQMMIKTVNRLM